MARPTPNKTKEEERKEIKEKMDKYENENGKVETSPIQTRTKKEDINKATEHLRKYLK